MSLNQTYSENELLLRIADGDQQAYTVIFHQYRGRIYSLAFHLTNSVTISEEIVQDAFLKVWQQQKSLPGIRDFDAWLFIIARNLIYSALRKMAREATFTLPETYEPADMDTVEAVMNEKEFRTVLYEALQRLSPQQQEVYYLIREQGLSREAAASKMGISPETVKVHLARAMRSIRAYITARLPIMAAMAVLWRYL